ncbi:hypothetical protein GCM10025786_31300 [Nocardioides caeni]
MGYSTTEGRTRQAGEAAELEELLLELLVAAGFALDEPESEEPELLEEESVLEDEELPAVAELLERLSVL